MSHRALRRMRQEREPQIGLAAPDDSEDEEDDDSGGGGASAKLATNAFAMMDDSDDEDNDDEESCSSGNDDADSNQHIKEKNASSESLIPAARAAARSEQQRDEVEDLDALLEEYKLHDQDQGDFTRASESQVKTPTYYTIITRGMDPRDLDIDYVMRTALLLGSGGGSNRKLSLFGPPRDNWPRPPHYVGGGMGMITYNDDPSPPSLPWPYLELKENDERCPPSTSWFKFTLSDSYQRDLQDLETIKASGDANALAMFVAHHPFVVEALLQLSIVLYQTSQRQEGLSILKRSLWVFECAALNSFLKTDERLGFLDHDLPENVTFFDALFRLMRVSAVAGLPRTALAASRFLLSLDPLRDPTNVLLAIDYFAMQCNSEVCNEWLVEFVESKKVYVAYRDADHPDGFECNLLDLPNFSYSYALALFRVHQASPSKNAEEKADQAIQTAMSRFPTVINLLLASNDVNTNSRSMQTDWPSVMEFVNNLATQLENSSSDAGKLDPVVRACSHQAYETIVQIFVQQNRALWGTDNVMKWMYSNLEILKTKHEKEASPVVPLPPAIMRFARCDPSNYEDKFQTMPAEANPLDPNVVAHALVVQVNRPRLIQRGQRGGGGGANGAIDDVQLAALAGLGGAFAGPPTVNIDPDSPLLEVFWRSALPWAHVEGVPPPNREN